MTLTEDSLPANWTRVPTATTCSNAGGATVGSLSGTTYTVPGGATGHTFAGAAITCTITHVAPRSEVEVTKTVAPDPVVSGQVANSIVVRNKGPQPMSSVVLADVAGAGQNCSVPAPPRNLRGRWRRDLSGVVAGVHAAGRWRPIPTLPLNGQVTVTLQCPVTATGF